MIKSKCVVSQSKGVFHRNAIAAAVLMAITPVTGSTYEQPGSDGFRSPDQADKPTSYRSTDISQSLMKRVQSEPKLIIEGGNNRLVFIDTSVADYQRLVNTIEPGAEVFFLDARRNGVKQIADFIKARRNVHAVHVIAHGDEASIYLGSVVLNAENLYSYRSEMDTIKQALAHGADMMLYSCNTGQGDRGQALVDELALMTGADVAASDDLTGHADLGGDWDLEVRSGDIDHYQPWSEAALKDFTQVLATETLSGYTDQGATLTDQTMVGASNFVVSGSIGQVNTNAGGSGAFLADYSTQNATGLWMRVDVDGTNLTAFQLTGLILAEYLPMNIFQNFSITGYVYGGGTVSGTVTPDPGTTGVDSYNGVLTNFSGVNITGFKINFDAAGGTFTSDLDIQSFNWSPAVFNSTPTISISNTILAYTENGAATQIDSVGTVSDSDGDADWNGGTLEVQITANNEAADEISIPDNVVGSINTTGTSLRNGATTIGTLNFSEGTVTGGVKLTITFNSNATNALVQQTLRAIHYRNTSDTPGTSNRTVTFTATDKNTAGASDTRTISVASVNDPPTVAINTGSSLNEGAVDIVSNTELNEGDPDDAGTGLTYTVTTDVSNGQLFVDGNSNGVNDGAAEQVDIGETFTQNDINNSRLKYQHDGSETTSDSFVFSLADGGEDGSSAVTGQTFNFTVAAINDPPTVATNTGSSLNEGAVDIISNTELNEGDPDDAGAGLTYTVTTDVTNGQLFVDGNSNGVNDGAAEQVDIGEPFTQDDIDNSRLKYQHDGSETTSDSFVFSLADGGEDGSTAVTGQTFNFTVAPINDPPTVAINTGSSLNEGAVDIVSNTELNEGDPDDSGAGLTYTVTTDVANGQLFIDGNGNNVNDGAAEQVDIGETFTQDDIDNSLLKYEHDGGDTTGDSFVFSLADGGEDGSTAVTGQTFNFTISGINDDPVITSLPTDIMVLEDTASNVDLSAATFNDPDSGANSITLTIDAGAGTLAASSGGGVTISGSGTAALTLTGTEANIDSFLNTASNIQYTGASNVNGNDATTLTLTANDGGNTGNGGGGDVSLGTVNVDITSIADTPSVTNATTNEDTQSSSGLVISRNANDSIDVTHFKVTGITRGTLYKNDGTTVISNDSFITFAEGNAGLKFTPAPDSTTEGTFDVQAATDGVGGGLSINSAQATITVTPVNDAPSLTNLNGDAVSYTIGSSGVGLDAGGDATLSDIDSPDFDGGNVTVSIIANVQSGEDVLQIGTTGPIGTSGSNVTHTDGVTIATFSGGSGGTNLVITLNTNATIARVRDLLSALQYTNTDSATENTDIRTVRITVNDGDGGTSSNQDISITLNAASSGNSYTGPSPTGTGEITATVTGGDTGCKLTNPMFLSLAAAGVPLPSSPPLEFPHGLFDFSITGCAPGATVKISITYPLSLPGTTQYWKYGPTPDNATPHWYILPATISGNTVMFDISDGKLGDDDLTENGAIDDIGGAASVVEEGAGGGNGKNVKPIPTLSGWAMIALSALLMMGAAFSFRQKQRL